MNRVTQESRALHAALVDFSLAVTELHGAVVRLGEQVRDDSLPSLSADQLESAWGSVRSWYERVEAKFSELAESAEDTMDIADALADRAEGGEPVSLEDLKADLGIE